MDDVSLGCFDTVGLCIDSDILYIISQSRDGCVNILVNRRWFAAAIDYFLTRQKLRVKASDI